MLVFSHKSRPLIARILSNHPNPSSINITKASSIYQSVSWIHNLKDDKESKKIDNNNNITYGVGIIGNLANSSVLCRADNTVVHSVITSKSPEELSDNFLPLTVDYRNRLYGHGLVPETISRKEKHGNDDEILAARIIDRAIRPLFPNGFLDEVQIKVTAHAIDHNKDPVVLGVNATSCALSLSKLPWNGPLGCVRVGLIDNQFVLNPSVEEMEKSSLDLLYAATSKRPLM